MTEQFLIGLVHRRADRQNVMFAPKLGSCATFVGTVHILRKKSTENYSRLWMTIAFHLLTFERREL